MNIQDSLHQVLASKTAFGEDFYRTFFRRCPEARVFFAGVDLERQAILLTMSLLVIEKQFAHPYAAAAEYLRYLGTKHHDRKIPKHLYAEWRDAMLETLAKFHATDWNDELQMQWYEAIELVTDLMFQGYKEHYTV
ncbi:MAG: globin domain-containing protein [Pirellulaceae bacterium]